MAMQEKRLGNVVILVPVLMLGGLLGARMFSPSTLDLTCCSEHGLSSAGGGGHQHHEVPVGDLAPGLPVEHATPQTFDEQVLLSSVPVLVDFYADWCVPCQLQGKILDEVAAELDGVRIVKVNIDESPELAQRFQVEHLPTLMIFQGGKPTAQQVGVASKEELKRALSG